MTVLRVVLEVAPKRSFASAIDWPGWARSGRTPDEAVDRLTDYAPRYDRVARLANERFAPRTVAAEVVERLVGGSGTEFGVPGTPATSEADPLDAEELRRLLRLLRAAWRTFDHTAESARAATLRLGPRGGGRQVPKIVDHVREAEAAYVRQLGARSASTDLPALRDAFVTALTARATGAPVESPSRVKAPWAPRYAIRRSAWHALDHAWEVEDRLEDTPPLR